MEETPKPYGIWKHKRTGKWYVVLGTCFLKTGIRALDDAPAVRYRPEKGTDEYVRTEGEFVEKFEMVRTDLCSRSRF